MTLLTFTPVRAPDQGTTDKPEFKVLKADFGDGYTQYAADGMNNVRRVLVLTWTYLMPVDAQWIMDFMRNRGGWEAFYYTPSDETDATLRWTCEDPVMERQQGGLRKVSVTLRQSFNLDGT